MGARRRLGLIGRVAVLMLNVLLVLGRDGRGAVPDRVAPVVGVVVGVGLEFSAVVLLVAVLLAGGRMVVTGGSAVRRVGGLGGRRARRSR